VVGSGGSVDRFWRVVTVGFRGFLPLQQQTNRKSTQQQTSTNHRNKKLTITTTNQKKKKKTKHNNKKSANTPILDRTGEVEGGAAAEPARSGQNPARSHQIWRDLTRSGEISLDLARSHQIR
jgi:hypothetical protein